MALRKLYHANLEAYEGQLIFLKPPSSSRIVQRYLVKYLERSWENGYIDGIKDDPFLDMYLRNQAQGNRNVTIQDFIKIHGVQVNTGDLFLKTRQSVDNYREGSARREFHYYIRVRVRQSSLEKVGNKPDRITIARSDFRIREAELVGRGGVPRYNWQVDTFYSPDFLNRLPRRGGIVPGK